MPRVRFHVEIRRGFRVARALNLTEAELHAQVLERWRHGAEVALGDRRWSPSDAALRVLEGPELDAAQLAMGQGWTNAERSARDVTARLLAAGSAADAPPPVALLAQSDAARDAALAVLAHAELEPLDWEPVRATLLAPQRGEAPAAPLAVSGALVVLDPASAPAPAWWLDVGLALGAFGWRALPATLGDAAPPPPLEHSLPLGDPSAAASAVRERLRLGPR
jgi:hypothetical protein